ncbi:hypothetical protein IE81DRAFT_346449 [Ceraceosorus guamensis]|uniref:Uncharacterized protein n=1 Tax=Ceraceosorus guamensis TaxID=1522189 RepID=A0A316W6H5_9BASI|nr:hypothetical protein IE81DRAFT_346449 [Ceraceosorus guamensis]PWN43653.1 hypothetical protein IE81DRAFT_346449 [Ceraceosorus guamensis]
MSKSVIISRRAQEHQQAKTEMTEVFRALLLKVEQLPLEYRVSIAGDVERLQEITRRDGLQMDRTYKMLEGMQLGRMLEGIEARAAMDGFSFIPETSDWESDTDRFNLWTQITSARWIKSYKEWLDKDKSASHNKTPATLGLGLSDVAGPSRQQDSASAPSRGLHCKRFSAERLFGGKKREEVTGDNAGHKRQASKSPMLDGAVWRKLTGKRRTDE